MQVLHRYVSQLALLSALLGLVVPVAEAQRPPARPEDRPAEDRPAPRPTRRGSQPSTPGAPPPVLLVSADMDCRLQLDGEHLGDLEKDVVQEFRVRAGEHLLQAFPTGIEGPVWKETVEAPETGKVVTTVELRKVVDEWREEMANVARFEIRDSVVEDTHTGLTWARTASPEMRWEDIGPYCARLGAEGVGGWRLPSLDEASKLYWPDHPSPPQETTRDSGEWTIFGRKRGEMQVLPRLIFEPFDQSSVDAIWVSGAEERIACSFLGEFTCTVEGRKAEASTFCVRRAEN